MIQPGQAKGTVGLSYGYGRSKGLKEEMMTGVNAFHFYENFNPFQLIEIEATEETVQAAQQEEEITRMNNSLVLSVSSTQRRPGLRAASLSPLVLTLFPIWKGYLNK